MAGDYGSDEFSTTIGIIVMMSSVHGWDYSSDEFSPWLGIIVVMSSFLGWGL